MSEATRTFGALADPVRSTIVERLEDDDATVGELAELFAISLQAVSRHVGVLEAAGLVTKTRVGRTARVRLERAPLDEAASWLEARRRRLEERYRRLDDVLAELTDPDPTSPHTPPSQPTQPEEPS